MMLNSMFYVMLLKSKMNKIKDNLDYFSDLTQRTLSAFHISGTDITLIDEITQIKKYLNNYNTRILVTIEKIDNNTFKRIFMDSHEDIVTLNELESPSYYEDNTIKIINNALSTELSPIVNLRYGKKIKLVEKKPIESISEYLFFIDMLDYINSQDTL